MGSTKKVSTAKLKRLVRKSQPQVRLAANVDVLIYLECLLFMKALAREAQLTAQASGQKLLQGDHVRSVTDRVLQAFKG